MGDKVVLSPGSVSDPITSITWKHGPDIAVEWYGGEIVPYRDFRGTYAKGFNIKCMYTQIIYSWFSVRKKV